MSVTFYVECLAEHPISRFVNSNIMIARQVRKEVLYCEPEEDVSVDSLKKELERAYRSAGFEVVRIVEI